MVCGIKQSDELPVCIREAQNAYAVLMVLQDTVVGLAPSTLVPAVEYNVGWSGLASYLSRQGQACVHAGQVSANNNCYDNLAALLVRAMKTRPRVLKLELILVVSLVCLCPPHSELESLSDPATSTRLMFTCNISMYMLWTDQNKYIRLTHLLTVVSRLVSSSGCLRTLSSYAACFLVSFFSDCLRTPSTSSTIMLVI